MVNTSLKMTKLKLKSSEDVVNRNFSRVRNGFKYFRGEGVVTNEQN